MFSLLLLNYTKFRFYFGYNRNALNCTTFNTFSLRAFHYIISFKVYLSAAFCQGHPHLIPVAIEFCKDVINTLLKSSIRTGDI